MAQINKRKKILFILDHPSRDLKGLTYLIHRLITLYGYLPVITGTRNEARSLVLHRPDLMLISHLLFPRHIDLPNIAKSVGARIGLLPTEGSNEVETNRFSLAQEALWDDIDLILPWGKITETYLKQINYFKNAEIHACGCPRFDFHTNPKLQENADRRLFCEKYGLDPEKPIVFWATGTVHANRESQLDSVWNKRWKNNSQPYEYYQELFADNTLVMKHSSDMVEKLSKAIADRANLVIKPHPQEDNTNYDQLKERCPSIISVPQSEQIENFINNIDILLHFRCSTSFERWMIDIAAPTIHITHKDVIHNKFREHVFKGSDVVYDYDSLYRLVSAYLEGQKATEDQIAFRRQFIEDYLCAGDSGRAKYCAETIDAYLRDIKKRCSFHKEILTAAPRIFLKNIIKKDRGKYIRSKDHMDYLDKSTFVTIMNQLNKMHNTNVNESDYILDI